MSSKKKPQNRPPITAPTPAAAKLTSFFTKKSEVTKPQTQIHATKTDDVEMTDAAEDGPASSQRSSRSRATPTNSPAAARSPRAKSSALAKPHTEAKATPRGSKRTASQRDVEEENGTSEAVSTPVAASKRQKRGEAPTSPAKSTSSAVTPIVDEQKSALKPKNDATKQERDEICPTPPTSAKKKSASEESIPTVMSARKSRAKQSPKASPKPPPAMIEDLTMMDSTPKATTQKEFDLDAFFAVNETPAPASSPATTLKKKPPAASVPASHASPRGPKSPLNKSTTKSGPSSSGSKARASLGFALPAASTKSSGPQEDPVLMLANNLASREFEDFHDNFLMKMDRLDKIILDRILHPAWTLDTCAQLFLQMNMCFMHASYKRTVRPAILATTPIWEKEQERRPWTISQARVFTDVLRSVVQKAAEIANTSHPMMPPATSSSSLPKGYTATTVERLIALVQIIICRFSSPLQRGSYNRGTFPSLSQQANMSYFDACMDFLVTLGEGLLAMPEKELTRLRDFLLRVIAEESRDSPLGDQSAPSNGHATAAASATSEQLIRRTSSVISEASSTALNHGELISSAIGCCQGCNWSYAPVPTANPLARSAIYLFHRLAQLQGITIDTAAIQYKQFCHGLPDHASRLYFLFHLPSAVLRAHYIGFIIANLGNEALNGLFFVEEYHGLRGGIKTEREFNRLALQEDALKLHLELVERILEWAKDYRTKWLKTTKDGLKAAKRRIIDSSAKNAWAPPPANPEPKKSSVQPSAKTLFAKQKLQQLQASKPAPTLEEIESERELAVKVAADRAQEEFDRLAVEYRSVQQHYVDLITLLLAGTSELVHAHMLMFHPECPIPSDTMPTDSQGTDSSVWISDSQSASSARPSTDDSMQIDATPVASQESESGSVHTSPSKKRGGAKKAAPTPKPAPALCGCHMRDSACDQLQALYQSVHQRLHEMQAACTDIVV